MSIWVSENYARRPAARQIKCGSNYATEPAQAEAIDHGCDQVIFLDAVERRCIEELASA